MNRFTTERLARIERTGAMRIPRHYLEAAKASKAYWRAGNHSHGTSVNAMLLSFCDLMHTFFVTNIQSDCLLLCACAVIVHVSFPSAAESPLEGMLVPGLPPIQVSIQFDCVIRRDVNAEVKSEKCVL